MFQVFLVGINFVSMLVLVRLLPPSEYGRATAATGIMAVVNCFNCSYFIAQALQLHEGEEPDWAAHWSAGFYIQFALFVICNALALLCWFLPPYRPIAGLLSVASVGLLLDCPNQLSLIRLKRKLDYRSLRLIEATCALVTLVSSLSLAFWGAGAFALIIGSNVLHGMPQGAYLLFVQKWRPPSGWWHWPVWKGYTGPLRFGAQLSGSALLTATRGVIEATVLPATLGYEAVGLLNRAQVLFSTTVGRVATVVVETVYPLLPRSAGDPEQFSRHATLFAHTMFFASIPGAVFVGIEGPALSRLLYGAKWIGADPLILPGTVFAWAVSAVMIFATVLQARSRMRLVFISSLIAVSACLPATVVALIGGSVLHYSWTLALGQIVAAYVAARLASGLLQPLWVRQRIVPLVFAAAAGACALLLFDRTLAGMHVWAKLPLDAALFALVTSGVLRCFFAAMLQDIVQRLPAGGILSKLFRL